MLNQVVLVGKAVGVPSLKETSNGIKYAELILEIERNFKNTQGDFETDPEVAEEIGQMLVNGIKKAGTMLKMQVPLDGEFKVGNNAAEIH